MRLLGLALSLGFFGVSLSAAACQQPTRFVGEPKFPGGPSACAVRCESDGLEMSSFVYSGEFATSCVCGHHPKDAPAPSAPTAPGATGEAAEADPMERRGPADHAGVAAADNASDGAHAAQVAADALRQQQQQQQQMLQHRKP